MANEKLTRDTHSLPPDDYTVIARLSSYSDRPYGTADAAKLAEHMQLQPDDIEVTDDNLYVRLRLGYLAEQAVAAQAAYNLHLGLAQMAISPEISAGADETKEVVGAPTLTAVFRHLSYNITEELGDALKNLEGISFDAFDFDLELQHLAEL